MSAIRGTGETQPNPVVVMAAAAFAKSTHASGGCPAINLATKAPSKVSPAPDAALAGGIGRDAASAMEREHRSDIDDPAARVLPDKLSGHCLGEKEHRL